MSFGPPSNQPLSTLPLSEQPPSSNPLAPSYGYLRSLVAAQYLLGARQQALTSSLSVSDASAAEVLNRCQQKLNAGEREDRARYLARQVTRMIRALRAARLR